MPFRFFCFIVLFFISSISLAQISAESIRVRLEKNRQELSVEGIGIQIYGREANYEKISLPKLQKIHISRVLIEQKPVWKIIRSQMNEAQIEIIADEVLAIKGIFLKSLGKNLPQQIFLWPQGLSKFDLVGVLPLEEYLVGVVSSEMPSSWPLQTLKSQAIAARSYALSMMQERRNQYFHVENSIMDQVFKISFDKNEKIKKAVRETENLVLTDKKGRILKSFFHSDCGGKTADARDVWGRGAKTEVVVDGSCPTNPKAKWNYRVSQNDMNKLLAGIVDKESGELDSITPVRGGEIERAYELELRWKNGAKKNILAQDFRQLLGFEKMKSTFFSMSRDKLGYLFTGQGYGHGVGLCQWGARALGLAGKDYIEILKHYYPQASLYLRQYEVQPEAKPRPELRLGLLKQKVQL
jgi:stage II sporulation protein D